MSAESGAVHQFNRFVRLLYGVLALVMVTVGMMVALDHMADTALHDEVRAGIQNRELHVRMAHLDEVLTMSARMAAATGEARWEQRYRHYKPILDATIKEAIRLYPKGYEHSGEEEIDAANQKLLAMEAKALAQAREGRLPEAAQLLNSQEYETQKLIYARGMKQFTKALYGRAWREVEEAEETLADRMLLLVPVGVLLVACVFVFRRGRALLAYQLKVERELRRHRDNLQLLVREQTASLRQAKEEAERANSLKSEFLANVTHELKTPVHCIVNFAQLGASDAKRAQMPAAQEYFDDIFANGIRLDTLISDLLDFSQMEAGSMGFSLDLHSMRALVENSIALTHGMSEAKQVHIAMVNPEADERVVVDARRMEQVLVNLISNAVRFSPEGGRILWRFAPATMRICDSNISAPALAITITDEGPGIPEEERERIFDHFVQGREAILKGGGTGLGLAICRKILQTFHGTIRAGNAKEGGAVFEIVLPLWHKLHLTLHRDERENAHV